MLNLQYNKLIDISISLKEGIIVYPGNPALEIEPIKSASGTSVISKVTIGTHTGTHIDAPCHVIEGAPSLESYPLESFIGPCRVLDCTADEGAVSLETIKSKNIQTGERILLKTKNSQRGFTEFYNDYIYISPEASEYLAEHVSLIANDYLSVKQKGSKDNIPHTAFLLKNIPIIEGVDLSKVEEGEYILVLLPLKFIGADGSPVRAVLLQ